MKRLLLCLAAALLLARCALAEEAPRYTVTSVVDCAQSVAAYDAFSQSGELSVLIPGLAEGLIPQGIAWMPEQDWLLFAGYRADKGASALLAVDRQTGALVRQAALHYGDGRLYSGHAGGVCVTESDIFLSNAHTLYRISKAAFLALPAAAECRFEEEIPVPVNASYCCYAEGVLWVGEFQYGSEYPTDRSHSVRTADGTQKAWTCGYKMAEDQTFEAPDFVLSVPERVQGITTRAGRIYLSQSYGRRNSSLLMRYADVLQNAPDGEVALGGRQVPLWILDSAVREAALRCPPMSECLCDVPEGVCVLFESAADKYRSGKNPSLHPMDRVFLVREALYE